MEEGILDLPGFVLSDICSVLDSSAQHNWKKLLEHLPDYTQKDVLELCNLAQQGHSASRELLQLLTCQGLTVADLGRTAKKAGIHRVVEILTQYCEEEGIEADFTVAGWVGAKSCFHRSSYSDEVAPPTDNMAEACQRYGLKPHPPSEPTTAGKTLNGCISKPATHEGAPPIKNMEEASQRCGLPPYSTASHEVAPPTKNMKETSQHSGLPPSYSTVVPTASKKTLSEGVSVAEAALQETANNLAGMGIRTQNGRTTDHDRNYKDSISSSASTANSGFGFEVPGTPAGLEEVRYEVLMEATAGFDRTPYKEGGHKVGEGGFGEVFQCSLMLKGGPVHAAVKVLLNKESDGMDSAGSAGSVDSVDRQQFSTETQQLSKLSHECLLPVLGYSCNGPRLCLIYPFMSNGSLEAHLPNPTTLSPSCRLRVAYDVASALHYLHCMPGGAVVHRDVKSANILLSEEWRGRLGDFGLARTLPTASQNCTSVLTNTIVGTPLYMAPEAVGGTITPAADVYAFGVVLFELLTGKCALNRVETPSGEDTDLLTYIEEYDGEQNELVLGEWEDEVQAKVWALAEDCIINRRIRRPNSSDVFMKLSKLCS